MIQNIEEKLNESASAASLLRWASLFAASLVAALFIYVALSRMFYPYEIEFEEGDLFLGSLRVLDGKSLYPSPDSDPSFVPVLYVPLYYWANALFMLALGKKLWVMRLVSTLCACGIAALTASVAKRSGAKSTHAATSGLMFLCFFSASGFWFDLARVDMMFMLFALGAFYILSVQDASNRRLLLAGALLVAATYIKQPGIFFAASATLFLMTRNFKRGFAFGAACLSAILLIGLAYHVQTDGQFTFFTLTLGSSHEISLSRLLNPVPWLKATWPLVLAMMVAIALHGKGERAKFAPWIFYLLACVPAALLPWSKVGFYLNNLIPLFSALCILAALADKNIVRFFMICQAVILLHNPAFQIPDPSMREDGARLIQSLAEDAGSTYLLDHSYYSWLAGKPTWPKGMFIAEAQKADRPPPRKLVEMIDKVEFDRIIVDLMPPFDFFSSRIMRRYKVSDKLTSPPQALTGALIYPKFIMTPVKIIQLLQFDQGAPTGWMLQGDRFISPLLPDFCASISFEIEGDAGSSVRLYAGDRVIAQTGGVPGKSALRTRWLTDSCTEKGCRIVVRNLKQFDDGRMSVKNLNLEF